MPKSPGDSIGFPELHTQLRIANRLKAAELKATLGQQELVRLLVGTGATQGEIADILGTTAGTVSTTIQRLKRRNKGSGDDGASSEAAGAGRDLFPGGSNA
jgi:DNA-binding CsgD family transcriptional regulator